MINNPSPNPSFTSEQEVQLETFTRRLVNLQTEIAIHSDKTGVLREENVNLEKKRAYLNEQISNLEQRKRNLEKNNEELTESISNHRSEIGIIVTEKNKLISEQNKISIDLQEKKDALDKRETLTEQHKQELNKQILNVAEEKNSLQKKSRILSEALQAIGN